MIRPSRITAEEALELYRQASFCELACRAGQVTELLHPGNVRTYAVERNINYTNVCVTRCSFCAFSVSPGSKKGYVLSDEELATKIKPLVALGGTQILLQGGMNPDLSFEWYENMLRAIKRRFARLHIHAFSPPEIVFMARRFELSIDVVLGRLCAAGLDTLPGGGAEVLVDRVRRSISPAKCDAGQWLDVMRRAHRLGMCTTATMMFGHLENIAERVEHLDLIRSFQDESLSLREKDPQAGFFTAFICWPFQEGGTRLARRDRYDPAGSEPRLPGQLLPAGACEQLRMTALARLYLDNIPNIQASWVTQGPDIGQLSLRAGCNDAGSLMMEENVVAAAGTSFTLQLDDLRGMIRKAGFIPVQRDCYYNHIGR